MRKSPGRCSPAFLDADMGGMFIQPGQFVMFFCAGMAAAVWYTGCAVFRRHCRGKWKTAAWDLLFCLGAAGIFAACLFFVAEGALRAFSFFSFFLGFLIFYLGPGAKAMQWIERGRKACLAKWKRICEKRKARVEKKTKTE